MSCGLPAVVPDDGGAAEMHDPASGERYVAGDTEACAEALERLLNRVARDGDAMRAAAARAAARLPSVRQQFDEQIALYTELLARRGEAPGELTARAFASETCILHDAEHARSSHGRPLRRLRHPDVHPSRPVNDRTVGAPRLRMLSPRSLR